MYSKDLSLEQNRVPLPVEVSKSSVLVGVNIASPVWCVKWTSNRRIDHSSLIQVVNIRCVRFAVKLNVLAWFPRMHANEQKT